MKFISFYTYNTPYEEEINNKLIPSLKKFNLDYYIQGYKDRGNWGANTGIKSEFIRDTLLKYNEPICFLDADAIIVNYPQLLFNLPSNIDLSYHNLDWFLHWRNQPNKNQYELLSGTMVFFPTSKVINLLNEWITKVQQNLQKWEQLILSEIIENKQDLNIYILPAEYCVVPKQDNTLPIYLQNKKLYIYHTQASRKYKNRRLWPEKYLDN